MSVVKPEMSRAKRMTEIERRRDWRMRRDLSTFELRLDDECLAKHYAEDVTFLLDVIRRHDADRELGRCDGLLEP